MMQEGKIVQAGKFEELFQQNIGFEILVGAHNQALESILSAENSIKTVERKPSEVANDVNPDLEDTSQIMNVARQESPEVTDVSGGMASICHVHPSNWHLHMVPRQYYIPTAREPARLSGIQRAAILHHFAESLAGVATIREFNQEHPFIQANLGLIDGHSRQWFQNVSAMEWLSFRLNLLSNLVCALSLVLLVSLPEGITNPSIAGLAVTYGLNRNVQEAAIIWNMCNAENKMISGERILQYSRIASDAPLVIEDRRPPQNWPSIGTIYFNNLQVRYAEHLPSVLKNIGCTYPWKTKVGVVGRTGSGKSTLIQAIFLIVELREWSIDIDGVGICKIGLHDLRVRLGIIPLDPTLFEGTVRGNLDPLEEYPDHKILEALDKCQLGDLVRAKEKKWSPQWWKMGRIGVLARDSSSV